LSLKIATWNINSVRLRMNRQRALQAFLWAAIAGAGLLLAVALIYILNGYAVPRICYALAAGSSLTAAIVAAIIRRPSTDEAAACADEAFHLRDSIVSHRRFQAEHRAGGFFDLQANTTAETVAALNPAALKNHHLAPAAGLSLISVAYPSDLEHHLPSSGLPGHHVS
jgi:hypothetical protein